MSGLRFAIIVGMIVALGTTLALAATPPPQHPCQQHGMHYWKHYRGASPRYDVDTELTLKGVVEKMWTEDCQGCGGCAGGVHLLFATKDATYEAHLGPSSYLATKQWELTEGEEIELTGSLVSYRTRGEALIVREVKKGEETLTLRDEKGIPLWSRGRP